MDSFNPADTEFRISQLPDGDLKIAMSQLFEWGMFDFNYDKILEICKKYNNNTNMILEHECQ